MLKLRYITTLLLALASVQALAQQNSNEAANANAKTQNQNIEIDPMKGCYAANQFYSEGMRLEVKSGTVVCAHGQSMYGKRDASLPFEWAKESDL